MDSSSTPSKKVTRRGFLGGSLAVGTAALLAGCGFGEGGSGASTSASLAPAAKAKIDGDLVYFNWADYIAPDLLDGFAKEYGVKVTQANYDSPAAMIAKMNSGNQYDIVFPGSKEVSVLLAGNLIQRIDKAQLKNADQVFGRSAYFDSPWYDPNSDHSVPYTLFKTGIAYRKDKVNTVQNSWDDLWNAQASGRIFVLDDVDEALGMAALKLRLDINTTDSGDLAKIQELLIQQKPLLRGYSTDDITNMANGNAWVHHMWSGDFVALVTSHGNDASKFAFEAPKEGTPLGNDAIAIPTNAAHPGTALMFIDYLLRPENIVKNVEYLGYAMPMAAAEEPFKKIAAGYPQVVVTSADLDKATVFKTPSVQGRAAREAVWTAVKAS